ncbi:MULTISPECIES: type II toxin-antitoxin system HipA family toxin [unclassified Imperialibacter]|uniref:type II toxin-antitoxin system HipA family toxin n=1 Tax=unclassified Imperialibacter TaxID=2629706 RepID=UPI001250FE5B|nr:MULTISPECIES: HipA domain-containing protein [unclassified Imperialibacter]CAD5264370.1 Serine/threonine-protein kinase HipA [Imperialibacter sp. 89]CAD5269298.1 Serine/threonine-protein kinase HipA [Imperialibacter sp. 75]VVT08941.1 Serine/threonine-protein kinase HipA [Imperialibacter sp. EC-SDR9]
MAKREIYVFADWQEVNGPILMGMLTSEMLRGKEIFSFEYDKTWLSSGFAQTLDPDLQLYPGPQYLNDDSKFNFGLFLDSSPDRWGRVLMQRREAAEARWQERKPIKLFETDYLLGVYDGHRMGALRFKIEPDGPFLNNDERQASPPWTSIRELEQISLRLEEEGAIDHPDYRQWLNMLVNPGSSLGGARPKASVLDADSNLWIAKFPSKNDKGDMGAWEMVTYELAVAAGVHMAECQARKFTSDCHTFITKRFDRTNDGRRIHFTSAMTQLGYTDGADAASDVSYLELVDFLMSNGANVEEDLPQLWRRIVFSICVSNTDDHLRNHGFLLSNDGWHLSPAYDINPNESGTGLKLNISEYDNALELGLAMEVHTYFRLDAPRALEIMKHVRSVVGKWREVAAKYGISKSSQELKAAAFQVVE